MAVEAEIKTVNNKNTYFPCFCYSCGIEIWFSNEFMTPFNKKIPLDIEQDDKGNVKFHDCIEKKKSNLLKCNYCNEPISFSDTKLSKNGKKIPLCEDGSKSHDCPKNPYNQRHNNAKVNFTTGGLSERIHKTLEEQHVEFLKREEEFRRQWR